MAFGLRTTMVAIRTGCQTDKPGPTNPSAMADIMPADIIEHEWKEHGTCSGLSGDDYFALIRKVYKSIQIPGGFKAPASSFSTSPQKLKSDFERVNPGVSDSNVVIQLNGNYLNAVEFCVAKGSKSVRYFLFGCPGRASRNFHRAAREIEIRRSFFTA